MRKKERPPRRGLGRRLGRGLGRGVGRGLSAAPVWVWQHVLPRTSRGIDAITWVVTAILFVISWSTLSQTHDVPASLQPVMAGIGVVPLLLVRVAPFVGWAACAIAAIAADIFLTPVPTYEFPWQVTHFLVLLVLVAVVALRATAQEVAIAWAGTAAVFGVFMPGDLKAGWIFGLTSLMAAALLVRWLVISRRELAHQEEVSELERARRAVLEERSRIARDLHDVVAHRMSMVVVQAQSAPYRLGGVSPEVAAEFTQIGAQAREALNDVRGMLGVLRSDGQLAEELPQPGTAQVEELLEDTRAAGVKLHWSIGGDPAACGETAGMVVFRVLQESLANASRHAPGALVSVELRYDEQVRLLVQNTAGSAAPAASGEASSSTGGSGIPGMKTRAESIGGALEAGPTPEGGFAVVAWVPLTSTDRALSA